MPSPIAHAATGYLVYRLSDLRRRHAPPALALLVTVGLSFLPDLDSILGLALGDMKRFHNNLAHSFVFGTLVALALGGLVKSLLRITYWRGFTLALVCWEAHVLMDYCTVGRGVMVLWPLTSERLTAPVSLFYGVHWSDGWLSWHHLATVVTELATVALVGVAAHFALTHLRRHSPVDD